MTLRRVPFYISPILVAFYIVKTYCSSVAEEEDPNIATYEEVKNLKNHPEKVLIDVREPEELKETGQIPFCINIPRKYLFESYSAPCIDLYVTKKFFAQFWLRKCYCY